MNIFYFSLIFNARFEILPKISIIRTIQKYPMTAITCTRH